jgi:hypothetical protein
MFQLFKFLINYRIGRLYIIVVFIKLYKDNNQVAVFIANMILKLAAITDTYVGASDYATKCTEDAKEYALANLPIVLASTAVTGFVNTVIQTALLDPKVVGTFINQLMPSLSTELVSRSLPLLSQGLENAVTQGITSATPQIVDAITQSITSATPAMLENLAATLAPVLIEGVTDGVTTTVVPLITNAASAAVSQALVQTAQQQVTTSVVNVFSKYALGAAVNTVAILLTGDTNAGNVLQQVITNSGGKTNKFKKSSKRISKRISKRVIKRISKRVIKRKSKTYKK